MPQSYSVPIHTEAPIEYLLANGWTTDDLAEVWGYRRKNVKNTLRPFRRYDRIPPTKLIKRMAKTFGWTEGQVLDHWTARVKTPEVVL